MVVLDDGDEHDVLLAIDALRRCCHALANHACRLQQLQELDEPTPRPPGCVRCGRTQMTRIDARPAAWLLWRLVKALAAGALLCFLVCYSR